MKTAVRHSKKGKRNKLAIVGAVAAVVVVAGIGFFVWHEQPSFCNAFCLRSGCHDLTRDDLTEKTADMAFNPHRWQHEEFECSDCHKSHCASVLYCTKCHTDAVAGLPEGWVTYGESEQIMGIPAA